MHLAWFLAWQQQHSADADGSLIDVLVLVIGHPHFRGLKQDYLGFGSVSGSCMHLVWH